MQRRVYGHKKQGAAFGHTKIQGKTVLVRGLNTLAATISAPQAAPVVAGARLRGGSANTARGAASFAAEAIGAARAAGCAGTILTQADSGFYRPRATRHNAAADPEEGTRTSRRTTERREKHARGNRKVTFAGTGGNR